MRFSYECLARGEYSGKASSDADTAGAGSSESSRCQTTRPVSQAAFKFIIMMVANLKEHSSWWHRLARALSRYGRFVPDIGTADCEPARIIQVPKFKVQPAGSTAAVRCSHSSLEDSLGQSE